MTIGGWITFIFIISLLIMSTVGICVVCETSVARTIWIIICAILCMVTLQGLLFYYSSTESGKRARKTERSNLHGGIMRTVTVYDYNGNQINSWTGMFDVTNSEYETYFDINGKRVVIHGGIVINEEQ